MKASHFFLFSALIASSLLCQSCMRNSNDMWDDTKSASRHMKRGIRTLGGKSGDSRQICSPDEFGYMEDGECAPQPEYQASAYDYVPLQDNENSQDVAMNDDWVRQPKETPGEAGSSIPGIESFKDPSTMANLAPIFKNIHFDYNSNLIKGSDNLNIVHNIAAYMKSHPNTYVFIEGHTDERGPQAYNLALGSRRSNAVRNLLIQQGVNPDNLFTISYGKERPLVFGSHEEAWGQNRRAEFKIYER